MWLVNGEHDIAARGGRTLTKRAPGEGVRMVPGAGHYVPLEAPEALAAITSEVLAVATRWPTRTQMCNTRHPYPLETAVMMCSEVLASVRP